MMDWHTANVFRLVRKAADRFQEIDAKAIPIPHVEADPNLPTFELGGVEVAVSDDDIPVRPWVVKQYMILNNSWAPMNDFGDLWKDVTEAQTVIVDTYGKYLPEPEVEWDDPSSDAALTRWAFAGLAAQRLERTDDGGFVVRHGNMEKFAVREGLASYGGDAYFAEDGTPLRIHLQGKDVKPGDDGWEAAKFTFRSSGLTWTTLADHVGRCHLGFANALMLASRKCLPLANPLRNFVAPFHYRTAAINNGATLSLLPWGALLHRTSGFSWDAMQDVYAEAFNDFRLERFDEELKRKGVHPDDLPEGIDYAYGVEGLAYWRCLESFVNDSFANSPAMATVLTDHRESTEAFWKAVSKYFGEERELTESTLKDFLCAAFFCVSAYHSHVGSVSAYVRDPRFLAGKLWPDQTIADKQSSAQLCMIACITGFKMPTIDSDFDHLMPCDATRECAKKYDDALHALQAEMDERNAKRGQAFRSFEPARVATSVAI